MVAPPPASGDRGLQRAYVAVASHPSGAGLVAAQHPCGCAADDRVVGHHATHDRAGGDHDVAADPWCRAGSSRRARSSSRSRSGPGAARRAGDRSARPGPGSRGWSRRRRRSGRTRRRRRSRSRHGRSSSRGPRSRSGRRSPGRARGPAGRRARSPPTASPAARSGSRSRCGWSGPPSGSPPGSPGCCARRSAPNSAAARVPGTISPVRSTQRQPGEHETVAGVGSVGSRGEATHRGPPPPANRSTSLDRAPGRVVR